MVPEDEQTLLRVKDENAVADAIKHYASFVCQYNPSFKEADSVGCMRLAEAVF